jgi:hypothetical protein
MRTPVGFKRQFELYKLAQPPTKFFTTGITEVTGKDLTEEKRLAMRLSLTFLAHRIII